MGDKKPEMVVWSEQRGYYSSELSYGTNLGAPSIKLEDVKGWKQNQAQETNTHFKTKFDELKTQYENLLEEVYWNEVVYSSDYSFIPIIGNIYHLYRRGNNTTFLSIVEPHSWLQKHLGSFKLNSNKKWEKI